MFSQQDFANSANENMYSHARNRGLRAYAWSALTRRSRRLFTLAEVKAACTVDAQHYAGMRTVAIDQIRGSQDRGRDFDCDFNPRRNHNKERWMNIASARHQGKALPAVDLVRVGDVYFVRDGHHRISVARALGQREIDAQVTVWQVSDPLPWEKSVAAHSRTSQKIEIKQLYDRVRGNSARLGKHLLLSLGDFLIGAGTRLRARVASPVVASSA